MLLKRAERRFKLSTGDYAKLAAFRHALRGFLRFSEAAAEAVGLTAQHYQAMLVLRACPEDERVSINDLAHQLLIKHNSAVGLVDRLEQEGLMLRQPSSTDRRKVELRLTGRGRQLLARLAALHRRELQRVGPELHRFFAEVASIGIAAVDAAAGAAGRRAARTAAAGHATRASGRTAARPGSQTTRVGAKTARDSTKAARRKAGAGARKVTPVEAHAGSADERGRAGASRRRTRSARRPSARASRGG